MAGAEFLWFEHGESDQVTRLLWVPPVIHMIHANEKQSFEKIFSFLGLVVETWNLSLHDFTASLPA
jgi:hypothetical protein